MSVFYSKDHEWIDISGGVGTVGITEYAVHQLGDITFVDLPGVGKGFKQFGVICSVESVKAVSDIFFAGFGRSVSRQQRIKRQTRAFKRKRGKRRMDF